MRSITSRFSSSEPEKSDETNKPKTPAEPSHLSVEDEMPEDDVDRIFKKLQPMQPPAELIQRILSNVKQLPRPEELQRHQKLLNREQPQPSSQTQLPQQPSSGQPFEGLDGLVIRNERKEPS